MLWMHKGNRQKINLHASCNSIQNFSAEHCGFGTKLQSRCLKHVQATLYMSETSP